MDIKEIMKENIPALIQQNQNLQSELDKEIKKNSKLVKALKDYANKDCWFRYGDENLKIVFIYSGYNGYELAQLVLKEIGEE